MPGTWDPEFTALRGYHEEPFDILDVFCRHETEKAILCTVDGEDVWFPLSQVWRESFVQGMGDEGVLSISPWIARQKGLMEE